VTFKEFLNLSRDLTKESRDLGFGFLMSLKLRCDERYTHAFTACGCVFNEITLAGSNQGNYFENENACSKRKLKTTVATQLKHTKRGEYLKINLTGIACILFNGTVGTLEPVSGGQLAKCISGDTMAASEHHRRVHI